MAINITRPLFLLSLLVIASANDYSYSYDSSQNQAPNPTGEEKPESYTPQPVPSDKEVEKPKPADSYQPKPGHYDTELPDIHPPKPEVLPVAVEGLVLCKSDSPKYFPIQGALVRITCLAVDENGYEQTLSVCSGETDAKGYFYATLSSLGLDDYTHLKLTECKAFLESSPLETCKVPVDVNKGITGAPLSDYRVLHRKNIKLYSVRPFFFTSESNSAPNNDGY